MRVKVAEACGWEPQAQYGAVKLYRHAKRGLNHLDIPDYPEDLNACAQFEAMISDNDFHKYHHEIVNQRNELCMPICKCISATAEQRCLAFLKVKGIIL